MTMQALVRSRFCSALRLGYWCILQMVGKRIALQSRSPPRPSPFPIGLRAERMLLSTFEVRHALPLWTFGLRLAVPVELEITNVRPVALVPSLTDRSKKRIVRQSSAFAAFLVAELLLSDSPGSRRNQETAGKQGDGDCRSGPQERRKARL